MFAYGSNRFAPRLSQANHHGKAVAGGQRPFGGHRQARRVRGPIQADFRAASGPPETWFEPTGRGGAFRVIVEPAGQGFRHIVTPDEVRERLSRLPAHFLAPLEVVKLSRMTRKKRSWPLYGMQWGAALYLYPIEENLVEEHDSPPKPSQRNEARMYGGRWEQIGPSRWRLVWTEEALKDFYLNNILIHELGHLLDGRNSRTVDRERFAEWFALQYGYRPTAAGRRTFDGPIVRRHGPR